MNFIKLACEASGSQAALARRLGVTPAAVAQWLKGLRPVPPKQCVTIERATAGRVTRRDLRPDDWHLIWPELAGLNPFESREDPKSAPPAMQEAAHG